ncbi:MAG TPA: hypothetical protein DCY13_00370, partial [Verrucomicrobiales bacterium]|nr:hypothetical protein [Verrucomicrobiales bacterium]
MLRLRFAALLFFLSLAIAARAQTTTFTYQGQLLVSGSPHTGLAEFQFTLWDAASGGAQLAATSPAITAANVTNGLFATSLDFGAAVFTGADRWLDIQVRTGLGAFTPLTTRQRLTATPYAIRAREAAAVPNGSITGAMIANGAVGASGLADGAVTLTKLFDNSVSSAKIADGSVQAADVNAASFDTTFWRTAGNTGTTPGTHFLGTADNQPLEIRVNGQRALRIEPRPSSPNYLGGHPINVISNGVDGATIGGGGEPSAPQRIGGSYATITGGCGNTATGLGSTAIGYFTTSSGFGSVSMGLSTQASGDQATAIGWGSLASGANSTAMGNGTTASGYSSTAMGWGSIASGAYSTAMGDSSSASNDWTLAAGHRARAIHTGAFVWADSNSADFASTGNNQFRVRAAGGMEIVGSTNTVESFKVSGARNGFLSPVGLVENNSTTGQPGPAMRLVTKGGDSTTGVLSVSTHGVGLLATFGNASAFVSTLTTNGTWTALAFNPTSDRAAKENFVAIDPAEVLEKVAALPLARWNYKAAPGLDHIGPVAQDFHAAFGLNGEDD